MARKNTIRLLLINASDNDSELLVSLFRNAGRVARAHRIASADDLESVLHQSWDLLIADDNHPELKVETCLEHLRQAGVDFPIIVMRDTAELNALFAAGVRDVVMPSDEQRLICAALRELDHVEMQRNVTELQKRVDEAEQRNALLLEEADQAIAYVIDGMVIGANKLFAERFGYAGEGDIDCVPIVDLLTAVDQDGFKTALKNGVEAEFTCTGTRTDGESFAASVRLLNSSYDGDACTQLIVGEQANAAATGNSDCDTDTRLFTRSYLLEQLARRGKGWLLFVGVEKFSELRREIGFGASIVLLAETGRFLADSDAFAHTVLARVSDGGFAMLIDGGEEKAVVEQAQRLCRDAAGHDFTPALTISIGIAAVGIDDPADTLDKAFEASEKARAGKDSEHVYVQRIATRAQAAASGTINDPEHALDEALEELRFALLFQPIISLRGAAGEHYETLLRMRGATDTLELPDNFIEGLGVSASNAKLDRWILLEATKQLAANRADSNDTRLIINLTANAVHDESLATWLGVALKAAGLPASSLILQLREIDVLNDMKAAKSFAAAIHQLGCRVSLCGFGRTPESQKDLIKNVGADIVQIDGNFTRALHNSGDAEPLKALISDIGATGVKTIVPYVENASVLATLWQVGADFIQGHYLQAPSREMNYEFTDIA